MKINLFTELDIDHDFTVEHLLNNYFQKMLDFLADLDQTISDHGNQPFIIPDTNYDLGIRLKKMIIVSGMMMNKLTESPVFMIHTEMYLTNLKLSTIQALLFFFNLVCTKLQKDYSDVYAIPEDTYSIIQGLFKTLLNNNNIHYDVIELYKMRLAIQ